MNNRGNLFFSGLLILTLLLTAAFTGSCDPKTAGGGGTFKIGTSIRYDTLNPLSTQLMVTGELMMLIYDPLIRLDDEQDPVPCLAKSWETTGDDLTWTYHLARDVRWHDGRPFTSADVKFTCDLIIQNGDLGIGAQYGGWLDGVTEVTCPDAYTVVIRTESPKNNILYNPMPILPKHIWQKMSPAEAMQFENAAPIGTGPYRFKSRNDQSIALSKFKDYFSSGGRVETLVFTSYVDEEAMARDLKEGKLDAATNLGAAQYQELVKTRNINTIFGSVPGFTHMGINIHAAGGKGNPALQDRRVRQALDMAVDKQKIVKTCYGGVGDPGTSLINPGDAFHYVVPDTELRGFDTAKSAALLEAAGYVDMDQDGIREDKGGNRLSFNLYCVEDNADEVRAANIIAEGCRNAGIEIRYWGYANDLENGRVPMMLLIFTSHPRR